MRGMKETTGKFHDSTCRQDNNFFSFFLFCDSLSGSSDRFLIITIKFKQINKNRL